MEEKNPTIIIIGTEYRKTDTKCEMQILWEENTSNEEMTNDNNAQ